MESEWLYSAAFDRSLSPAARIERAALVARIFPFDPRLRSATAQLYSIERWPQMRGQAIEALQAAIARDPFAADLHRNLAGFYVEVGNMAAAEWEISLAHAISPKSPIVLHVKVPR